MCILMSTPYYTCLFESDQEEKHEVILVCLLEMLWVRNLERMCGVELEEVTKQNERVELVAEERGIWILMLSRTQTHLEPYQSEAFLQVMFLFWGLEKEVVISILSVNLKMKSDLSSPRRD
jgi:hypothetical protein